MVVNYSMFLILSPQNHESTERRKEHVQQFNSKNLLLAALVLVLVVTVCTTPTAQAPATPAPPATQLPAAPATAPATAAPAAAEVNLWTYYGTLVRCRCKNRR